MELQLPLHATGTATTPCAAATNKQAAGLKQTCVPVRLLFKPPHPGGDNIEVYSFSKVYKHNDSCVFGLRST